MTSRLRRLFDGSDASQHMHELVHHMSVAVVVASIVGLLHHSGKLEWLDSTLLRIAASNAGAVSSRPIADGQAPEVLLIGGALFEQAFGERSPLGRESMALLTQSIRTHPGGPPATVVFDLDLSVSIGDADGQRALDGELKSLVESGAHVVLPVPGPAHTPAALDAKINWVHRACSWGPVTPGSIARVVFASPHLRSSGGRLLQYSERDLSLGIAAARPSRFEDFCTLSEAEQRIRLQFVTSAQVPELFAAISKFPRTRPLNAEFFRGLDSRVHQLQSLSALPWGSDGQSLTLAGRTVFIGGAFDIRDRIQTALEPDGQATEGVTLHAAVYYSALNPVTVEQGFGAFALDIAVGVVMGYVFAAAWRRYDAPPAKHGWAAYTQRKLILLGIPLLGIFLVVFLIWVASGYLYPANLWVSPGPVILGVFAKLLLARGHHAATRELPSGSQWLSRALIASVVVANAAVILSH
jgi:hypothetical protein